MAAGTGGEVSSLEARSRPMRFPSVRQSEREHFDYRPSPEGLRRGWYRLAAYWEVFASTLGRRPALFPLRGSGPIVSSLAFDAAAEAQVVGQTWLPPDVLSRGRGQNSAQVTEAAISG